MSSRNQNCSHQHRPVSCAQACGESNVYVLWNGDILIIWTQMEWALGCVWCRHLESMFIFNLCHCLEFLWLQLQVNVDFLVAKPAGRQINFRERTSTLLVSGPVRLQTVAPNLSGNYRQIKRQLGNVLFCTKFIGTGVSNPSSDRLLSSCTGFVQSLTRRSGFEPRLEHKESSGQRTAGSTWVIETFHDLFAADLILQKDVFFLGACYQA